MSVKLPLSLKVFDVEDIDSQMFLIRHGKWDRIAYIDFKLDLRSETGTFPVSSLLLKSLHRRDTSINSSEETKIWDINIRQVKEFLKKTK